jgi:cytochrome P450
MARLTLKNVGKAFLSRDLTNVAGDLIASFTACQQFMMRWTSFLPDQFPTRLRQRYVAAVEQIDKVVHGMIAERRSSPSGYDDVLSVLLSATTEDGSPLHDRLIRDEIVTMLWAGHETTYNALEWAWYLLSQNPEAESRLATELGDVLGANLPTGGSLQDLHYTEMIFAETLRLYPPAWVLGRWAVGDDTLDSGMVIPAGTQVFIIPYAVHRDPRFFPNPDRFDPNRFTAENRTSRPPFSYFPFGGGHHVCIGEHFGKMEGVLTLATIAQQCKLTLVPGQHVTPKPLLTLRPKTDIMMHVARRC